ncbi:UvrD-helicase domain-containing protein [Corynebacterium casei]|uniref:DNA/RNA helicase, superfamily I n=1 Tax=Corynebacterium casei LMG S-19264 TaxID=1285583 RepID=A0ABM5PQR9_9CORY|nr:UvrD-helicase domain-containing protein [Corynebacterium casei]AHI20208.1 DNA/RNA helicase, superfamily I [Corynebacterium casei LMG S-19264]
MDAQLSTDASTLLRSAPCSVELPAGAGKTHLLCASAFLAGSQGSRSLILTHTNAGVDAIRKRLVEFRIPQDMVRVETLTSWAFTLVKSYSHLAGVQIGDHPDWSKSDSYLSGAEKVVSAEAVQTVLRSSFDYLIVDEYQDCTLQLHGFVLALAESIPKTIVLGDRMQAIFGFTGPLVDWNDDVQRSFPAVNVNWSPHRWQKHNQALGAWTLSVREDLLPGNLFDIRKYSVPGVSFLPKQNGMGLRNSAFMNRPTGESILILGNFPNDDGVIASSLGGAFHVLEDIQGRFIRTHLNKIPAEGDFLLASWIVDFIKECANGVADLDSTIRRKLLDNKPIAHLKRSSIQDVVTSLDGLRQQPSYQNLLQAANIISRNPSVRIYRREAWQDGLRAIKECLESAEESPVDNLAKVRGRLRNSSRKISQRVVSRTLLVKGLEFDHVIISDLQKMNSHNHLYVAISRAKKSVTLIGSNPFVKLE